MTTPSWTDRTTSVDTVNNVVCGTVSSLSPFAVFITVPFASLTARVEIERAHVPTFRGGDGFEIEGRGRLGQASDGIAPDIEAVTLNLGSFALTIPAGSFVKKTDDDGDEDGTTYRFKGVIGGISLNAAIEQGPGRAFRFHVNGRHASLGAIVNPLTVGLAIGNDFGSVVVKAHIER